MSCLVTVPTPLGIVTPWPVTPSRLSESQGTHASPPLEVRLPIEQSLRGQGVCPLRHWATPFTHRSRCWGPQAPCPMTPHPRPAHFQCSWAGSQTGCGYCLRTHRAWATDTGWPRRALRCGHVHSVMQSCRIETHMPLSWGISQGNLNDKGPNLDSGTLNSDTWSRWSEGEKRGTGWGWVTGSPTGQPTPLGKTQEPKILQADPAFRWVPWRFGHQGQKTRTSPCSEMWAVGLRGHSCFRPCKHRSGGGDCKHSRLYPPRWRHCSHPGKPRTTGIRAHGRSGPTPVSPSQRQTCRRHTGWESCVACHTLTHIQLLRQICGS